MATVKQILQGTFGTADPLQGEKQGTPLGIRLMGAVKAMAPGLHPAVLEGNLDHFQELQTLHGMAQADIDQLRREATGLPYFVSTSLNKVADQRRVRPWQRDFFAEACERWAPALVPPALSASKWQQPAKSQRLLQVAATGSGKSAVIALAPFLGARERCLVLVPNETILEGLRAVLGAPGQQGVVADPFIVSSGVLPPVANRPRVLVLNDLQPAARQTAEAMAESEIVLCIAASFKNRLDVVNDWMQQHKKPLFDLMITDEAHHFPAATWREIGNFFVENTPPGHVFNQLLLTATPNHPQFGDLDHPAVRDAPKLSSYSLLDAKQDRHVKGALFLSIGLKDGGQSKESCQLDVLLLVGDLLRSKMDADPFIPHRGLIVMYKIDDACALVDSYNALPDAEKPIISVAASGEPVYMTVAAYYTRRTGDPELAANTLERFSIATAANPIHCIIQCQKLGEGYDQPSISVLGICTNIGSSNKYAQFIGRGVRRMNVEATLAPFVDDKGTTARDNTCHTVSHHRYSQFRHWGPFTSQEGSGAFDPNAQDIPDIPDDVGSVGTDEPLADRAVEIAKRQKTAVPASSSNGRKVHRYAMARTAETQMMLIRGQMRQVIGQKQMLEEDARQHDMALVNWTIENSIYINNA